MLNTKKTKIVATLGPATDNYETVKELILAGANVFRLNFSHADYEEVKKRIEYVRTASKELNTYAGILADLQGPKLRIGAMEQEPDPNRPGKTKDVPTFVKPGDLVTFVSGDEFINSKERVYMKYANFAKDVKVGEQILVNDGKLIFEVVSTNLEDEVIAKVIQGGQLESKKGVNLPNTKISLPALTEKDIKDAIFCMQQGVDWFALSFVRHSKDIEDLKELIREHSEYDIPIIAKIEKPEALTNIDQIIANTDALMVARGDLAVETPAEEVPLVQKELVLKAKASRIPIIIATQMLDSMENSLTPKRAEVSDVANAVLDGADAVMLSNETAMGEHPVEVVRTMAKILKSVENSHLIRVPKEAPYVKSDRFVTKSICYQAAIMADNMEAKVITTLTNTGYTAFQVSALRPKSHIMVFTSNERLLTRLPLLWGVTTHSFNEEISTDETVEEICKIVEQEGYTKANDIVVSLTSMPASDRGMVNTIRITEVK